MRLHHLFSDGAYIRIQLMEGSGSVAVGSAAVGSVVIGSAVVGLLGAAAFFAVDGLMAATADAHEEFSNQSAMILSDG